MACHQQEGLVPFVSKYTDHQRGELARYQQERLVPFVSKYIDHQEGRWLVNNRRDSSLLSVSLLTINLRETVRHQEDLLVIFFFSRKDDFSLTREVVLFCLKFIGHQS
jgi:hypothetical protein